MSETNLKRKIIDDDSEREESSSKEQKSSDENSNERINLCNIAIRSKKYDGTYSYQECDKPICIESMLYKSKLCKKHYQQDIVENIISSEQKKIIEEKKNRLEDAIFEKIVQQMFINDKKDENKFFHDYITAQHSQFNIANREDYEEVKKEFLKLIGKPE